MMVTVAATARTVMPTSSWVGLAARKSRSSWPKAAVALQNRPIVNRPARCACPPITRQRCGSRARKSAPRRAGRDGRSATTAAT